KLPPKEESQPITFQFGLNGVDLENVRLNFANKLAEQYVKLQIGKSELVVDEIDLPNARIDLKSFDLHNSNLAYVQDKFKPSEDLALNPAETARKMDESVEKTQGKPAQWVLNLNELNISGVNGKFDNFNTPAQPRGIDYNHLDLKNLEIKASNFLFSQNKMGLELDQLKVQEKSGFRVEDFQAAIKVDSTRASLTDLNLKTGNSHLVKEIAIRYPSLETLSENPEKLALDIDVENSRIGMQDVLYFVPDLATDPSFRKIANSTIRIDGQANGTMQNLDLQHLRLAGLSSTSLNVSGNLKNLTDPDRLYLDLNIPQLTTTRTDINALLPAGTLPPDIQLPARLSLSGTYRGTLTSFDLDAAIRSSAGNLTAKIDMDPGPKGAEPFKATIRTDRLDMKQLLTEDYGLGVVSGTVTANGTGLSPETMVAKVKADLQQVNYNGYAYNKILVDAAINRNVYQVDASSSDDNLNFSLAGNFNLQDSQNPGYNFTLDLKTINLKALDLYPEDLVLQGKIKANLKGTTAATLNGTIDARQLIVLHQGRTFPVDSLLMTINQKQQGPAITVASDIMTANMQFGNDLATLPTALQKHFSNYFDLQPDPPFPANVNLGSFDFNIRLRKTGLITAFVPGLDVLTASDTLTGSYNSQTYVLKMDGSFSQIKYTDYNLRNLVFELRGDKTKMGYNVKVQEIKTPDLSAPNVTLSGEAHDNEISTRLAVAENNGTEKFVVGGLLNSIGKGYRFVLNPDQLVINRDKWTVPADNYLQFGSDFLYANNIKLERNGSFVSLNSTGPVVPNAPLQVQFSNFDIGYAMQTFQQEDSLIAGILNGEATIRNLMAGNPAFTSDLTVTDFAYTGVPVGNLALQANSAGGNRYNLNATLTGNGNQANITGFYEAQPTASLLNLTADIASLNLAAL
ncbi:MAG TPA: hypothetical protein VK927_00725, partial [Adhaeribacter sp.]|nr:hypothetical protein [Adhaeribacter sp.]